MCCCIPLRRLSYLGALLHMIIGLVYLFFLGKTAIQLFQNKDKADPTPRLLFGLLYMGYFSAFLPPGVFLFWGVHKQLRIFIVWPSIAFFFVQVYGLTVVSLYRIPGQFADGAVSQYPFEGTPQEKSKYVASLKASWMSSVMVQASVTIVYLFMLFFYYREIGPDPAGPVSRYAQAAQLSSSHAHQQQLLSSSHVSSHVPLHQQQSGHMGHNVYQHSHMGHNPTSSGSRYSVPPAIPPFSPMATLTYEQQQQLLNIQQQQQFHNQFLNNPNSKKF